MAEDEGTLKDAVRDTVQEGQTEATPVVAIGAVAIWAAVVVGIIVTIAVVVAILAD